MRPFWIGRIFGTGACALILFTISPRSTGQPFTAPTASFWRPDGPVHAVAVGDGRVYLGGDFSYVGPPSGPAGVVNGADARAWKDFPVIQGTVRAVASDGEGGWFFGGTFAGVGGFAITNLVHIRRDGSVDQRWNPNPTDSCEVITVVGDAVYVGGAFTRLGNQVRYRIARLDRATGNVLAWNPNANGTVRAIQVSGDTVYVGGAFRSIGGQTRNYIAALGTASDRATSWNPNASASVNALAVAGNVVYAGGSFTTIGTKPRNRIAALDAVTGAADVWNPNASAAVEALLVDGERIYAGGPFTSIGGENRAYLAAIDRATGLATSWNPKADAVVHTLSLAGTTLYVGGEFSTVGGQPRDRLAALDTAGGEALDWVPLLSGFTSALNPVVYAVGTDGTSVAVGGNFASLGGVLRENLAALDARSGEVLPWKPGANGAVKALAIANDRLYVGGNFTAIGGVPRGYLAALDPSTGQALDWDPKAIGKSAGVYVLALAHDVLFVGGTFTNIGGASRTSLAALDLTQPVATDWNPGAKTAANAPGTVYALLLQEDRLYVGGDFTTLGGEARSRIGVLRTNFNQALTWNPSANNTVRSLALVGNTLYVGGSFSSIGGQTRNRLAAVDVDTGQATAWNPDAGTATDRVVTALRAYGARLYVAGQFTILGGEFRNRLASLDLATGRATAWNPNLNGLARALAITDDTLFVAGDFTTVGSVAQAYTAAFSLAPSFNPISLRREANGLFHCQFTSGEGQQLQLQASPDLKQWQTLITYDVQGVPIDFTDADAPGFPARFYRVQLVPPP